MSEWHKNKNYARKQILNLQDEGSVNFIAAQYQGDIEMKWFSFLEARLSSIFINSQSLLMRPNIMLSSAYY